MHRSALLTAWANGRSTVWRAAGRKVGRVWGTLLRRYEIEDQIVALFEFALTRPDWDFLMTPIGAGLSGWTAEEMAYTLARAVDRHECKAREVGYTRPNVVIPDDLYEGVNWRET